MEHLQGDALKRTVEALADDIGPRPAGSAAEEKARKFLKSELMRAGITQQERLPFMTVNTWGYGLIAPMLMALLGGFIGRWKGVGRILGAGLSLRAAYDLWKHLTCNRLEQQSLYPLYPKHPGATLIARVPPKGETKHRVVLIGHTDSNKHRPSFSPQLKSSMGSLSLLILLLPIVQGVMTLFGWKWLQAWLQRFIYSAILILIADDLDEYVDGANDNASAVACVLGIGKQAAATPLENTEVWLAFTGSEEIGLQGTHVLLDQYGDDLRDAYFIDFEIVGKGDIFYVTRHSGFMAGTEYTPDADSLRVAQKVSQKHPDWGVTGRELVINEEVAALRRRGFRGICLVGLDEEGWLPNWHRLSDTSANIEPEPLEKAATFAWAMIQELDSD
jgi:hypothetical protein